MHSATNNTKNLGILWWAFHTFFKCIIDQTINHWVLLVDFSLAKHSLWKQFGSCFGVFVTLISNITFSSWSQLPTRKEIQAIKSHRLKQALRLATHIYKRKQNWMVKLLTILFVLNIHLEFTDPYPASALTCCIYCSWGIISDIFTVVTVTLMCK